MTDNRTQRAARKRAAANRQRGIHDWINHREADRLEGEAAELLTPDVPATVSMGEALPLVEGDNGSRSRALEIRDTLKNPGQVARDASAERTGLLLRDSVDVTALALDAADSINAGNSLEKMLAHQMALAHRASFEMADKALELRQRISPTYGTQAMQAASVETVRLMNASARMMSAFQQGLHTLQQLRHGGTQAVTVQHVHVSDGGQAMIGNVGAGACPGNGKKNGG